tara:strand:- start:1231 stop:2724 length:1494 start_codon:yes stop_codon:yes gene_type:complete
MEIPIDDLDVGDLFVLRPGEAVATDGEIVEGTSSLNQAPVTGESVPVDKAVGDTVFAASSNGEGALTVRATKTASDNTLARIIEMVATAQASKGQSQRFIERFGRRYSPAVLIAGVLIVLIPGLLGFGWQEWLSRATVFIVAAAPCALVISIPITLVAALGTAGRNGLLIKGGVHLDNLAGIRVLALDKTGTLTRGAPVVTHVEPVGAVDRRELLSIAGALEARSQHPLARAVLAEADEAGLRIFAAENVQALTGAGVKGIVNGQAYYIGNPGLFDDLGIGAIAGALGLVADRIDALQAEGNTVVLVSTDREILGLIAMADPLREGAPGAMRALKAAGIRNLVMLTGDNRLAAAAIAAKAGIDDVRAELKPDDKRTAVAELEREHGHVAMIGDCVNDAPALAASHVGIAMGAAGSDVALETADIALMADDLSKLPYLIHFSRRTWRVVRQNLILSVSVIVVLAATALTGALSLPAAVIAHEVSEFIVIANGLRLLKS